MLIPSQMPTPLAMSDRYVVLTSEQWGPHVRRARSSTCLRLRSSLVRRFRPACHRSEHVGDVIVQKEQFTAWITKYALTKGILERVVETNPSISATMVSVVNAEWSEHYHGKDWYRNRADAVNRAEQMRLAKIASLHDQIERLRAVSFT